MIPYEIDPSLHGVEPVLLRLDDGFSPPLTAESQPWVLVEVMADTAELAGAAGSSLQAKSAF